MCDLARRVCLYHLYLIRYKSFGSIAFLYTEAMSIDNLKSVEFVSAIGLIGSSKKEIQCIYTCNSNKSFSLSLSLCLSVSLSLFLHQATAYQLKTPLRMLLCVTQISLQKKQLHFLSFPNKLQLYGDISLEPGWETGF
jgi:hypothetical protein